jgi:hypothetical protein
LKKNEETEFENRSNRKRERGATCFAKIGISEGVENNNIILPRNESHEMVQKALLNPPTTNQSKVGSKLILPSIP